MSIILLIDPITYFRPVESSEYLPKEKICMITETVQNLTEQANPYVKLTKQLRLHSYSFYRAISFAILLEKFLFSLFISFSLY